MSEWTHGRINRLRDLAGQVIDTDEQGESFGVLDHSAALDAFDAAVTPDALLSLLDALEAARGSGWIAVTPGTMPPEGRNVLACYLSRYKEGKSPVIRAMWATSEMQDSWDWEDWEPDDEDRRDGWFETADNADVCWRISETVTHWCPLPSPPVQP